MQANMMGARVREPYMKISHLMVKAERKKKIF
jgi:hypothetical protein